MTKINPYVFAITFGATFLATLAILILFSKQIWRFWQWLKTLTPAQWIAFYLLMLILGSVWAIYLWGGPR